MNKRRMLTLIAVVLAIALASIVVAVIQNQRRSVEQTAGVQEPIVAQRTESSSQEQPEGRSTGAQKSVEERQEPRSQGQSEQRSGGAQKPAEQLESPDQRQSQRPAAGPSRAGQEQHKYTFQLIRMVRHIAEIDKDEKHALTPEQAKQVLDILTPLRSEPKLTEDGAKQVLKDLKNVFTADQLNAMARIKPRFQSGRTPGERRARTGSDGMDRRPPAPTVMKDFNPFYKETPKGDERAEQRAKRWDEFFAGLEKKAKSE